MTIPTTDVAQTSPLLSGELRPVRQAFIVQRVAPMALFLFLLVGVAVVVVHQFQPLPVNSIQAAMGGAVVLAAWIVVSNYWANVSYSKERYEFKDRRIIAHRGSPISEQTTELTIRNITHVKRRLPWPRYPLFGVGDVIIESAGSESSEIVLGTIHRPDQVYEQIADLLRANGFQMGRKRLIHEENPAQIGVIFECGWMFLAGCFAVFATIGELLTKDLDIVGYLLAVIPFLGFVWIIVHYLDMSRRTYRVYDDVVVYEEGFLTRDDAFIPGENIADSSTKQGLLDQIIGVCDVQISCQGSTGEIHFRRLQSGGELSDAVDRLVARMTAISAREALKQRAEQEAEVDEADWVEDAPPAEKRDVPRPVHKRPIPTPTGPRWTAELSQSVQRALAPYVILSIVLFPLIPIWLLGGLIVLIKALCTTYSVRKNSVKESYRFLHTCEREFTYDKVTGVVVHENPLDRMFGTVNVVIWSIGSGQSLDLLYVRKSDLDLDRLISQLGIPQPEPIERFHSQFSFGRMLRANLLLASLLGFLLAVLAAIFTAAGHFSSAWFYTVPVLLAATVIVSLACRRIYYQFCSLMVHRTHLECDEGWLFRKRYFARHDNVKRLEITRYPGGDVGSLRFVVAGERVVSSNAGAKASNKSQKSQMVSSYGFSLHYVDDVEWHCWAMDEFLQGLDPDPEQADPPAEHETAPAKANSLAVLILVSVIVFPLIALLPITIPLVLLSVRRRRYRLEPHRVLVRSGIVYRRQASILYDRIDSIRREQKLLNKLFGNGNVTVFTAGSSTPDLVLRNAPDFRQLYERLQQHYED